MKRFVCIVVIICLFSMTLAYADNNSSGETNYVELAVLSVIVIAVFAWIFHKEAQTIKTFDTQWHKLKIGMTPTKVVKLLGKPDDINRSVYSFGVHEQWVYSVPGYSYKHRYLYFEDDKLTSWQD